jgi:hypothetical protein
LELRRHTPRSRQLALRLENRLSHFYESDDWLSVVRDDKGRMLIWGDENTRISWHKAPDQSVSLLEVFAKLNSTEHDLRFSVTRYYAVGGLVVARASVGMFDIQSMNSEGLDAAMEQALANSSGVTEDDQAIFAGYLSSAFLDTEH